MEKKKIFIIEDDEKIRNELCTFLNKYGYEAIYSLDFEHVIDEVLREKYHLILLDINLPFFDGYHICREIRKKSSVPIIVVTSRDSEVDELMSMNLGADDFITKPYNTQILLARISSLLRRTYNNQESEILEYNNLQLDLSKSEVKYKDNKIELSKNESKILYVLIKNKEKIVSRNDIIEALWESDEFVDDNTLTVNINRLRKKLEEIGAIDFLKTKRGLGYILI
ncbi:MULTISPECIES: response regulator transcription factor [unclassified Clostridium]|jgi:two-component system response regulator|uniref:response regulator transcription factor n=1 Tax=unclassified Clostridium TaxID=2614128 RepID=UPI0025D0AA41|nr:response regulator transcription factor [Clostridium sp.]MCI6693919.1 response regulator transcription factor [Clostridium sp.]MDY2629864.1 response regulator transcription factor [Clostridium sp.]MDY4253694.1 response regulator transcription factor [Clostridium sp.]MDY6227686.1 response regulator transcription factor [Clostridium sp.]